VTGDTATPEEVGLSHDVTAAVEGDRILIDDGRIETRVEGEEGDAVVVRVESGGELGGRKGVNLPGVELDLDTLTPPDRRELELAAEKGVTMAQIALSWLLHKEWVTAPIEMISTPVAA